MNRYAKTNRSDRSLELLIYVIMWLLVFLFPVIQESVRLAREEEFVWKAVFTWWYGMIPFLIVFCIHNFILIPRLLLAGRFKRYMLSVAVLLAMFACYEYIASDHRKIHFRAHSEIGAPPPPLYGDRPASALRPEIQEPPHGRPGNRPPGPYGNLPKPLLVNVLVAFLLLGCNVAVVMLFKYQREEEDRNMLENISMREELKYLKSQINPHFFMNMLNNIHSMVEVNPSKAQDMILELSKLMRYVLYEGENTETSFANEVRFISSYVSLMRQRYPADKVAIDMDIPTAPSDKLMLPPLLFIAFVENAFKHGVSYLRKSVIKISLKEEDGRVLFYCRNTKPVSDVSKHSGGGVGLDNVRRRLELLYGERAVLDIEDNKESFTVNLTIPCH